MITRRQCGGIREPRLQTKGEAAYAGTAAGVGLDRLERVVPIPCQAHYGTGDLNHAQNERARA